jgi:NitT/TauT family transport system ATP-binding protein
MNALVKIVPEVPDGLGMLERSPKPTIHFNPGDPIVVQDLAKTFRGRRGEVAALDGLNFSMRPGEFVAVLGPSGCGKSTLLMSLAGLESPSNGRITVRGAPIDGPYDGTGIVFQDPTLMPWRSALDNVLFPIVMTGRSTEAYRERATELLAQVGLSDALTRLPRELSGGMRQRVALCRALIDSPDILFLDEPFSALDAITRDDMNQVLLALWERHPKTAIFVTHSIREAVLLADRILVMSARPGRIIADVNVPFKRPRDFPLTGTQPFNELCEELRNLILGANQGLPKQSDGGRA